MATANSKSTVRSKSTHTVKARKKTPSSQHMFLFEKRNFILMFVGLGLVILGFLLMIGGDAKSPTHFDSAAIYSFRRITLAPICIVAGFVVEVFAIMIKPKQQQDDKVKV